MDTNTGSFLWKIGGEAGFGIMTVGFNFAKIAARLGYHTADYAEYPSLIRGGHNTYEVHISEDKLYGSKRNVDVLVCLNKETYAIHKGRLGENSIVLYDNEMFEIPGQEDGLPYPCLHIPLKQFLKEHEGSIVQMNTIMMGATMGVMSWPLEEVLSMIEKEFSRKGEEVVKINQLMAQLGHDYIKDHYHEHVIHTMPPRVSADHPAESSLEPQLILTGNDAFALGAVVADCRLYAAYPMTPSSTVLTTMAAWAKKTGMIVRHAEDEISVINTVIGSAFAGARSACGTSGGGFALMTEALSYAGVTETPIVVFLSQRPGPATGLPTWTGQGDLLFALFAGHGEFPKIVLAPGDIEEMYQLSAEAFNLADIYQTPVIVMSDKHLSESHWSSSRADFESFAQEYIVDRGKITRHIAEDDVDLISPNIVNNDAGRGMPEVAPPHKSVQHYMRYKVTDDGMSPMLIPGQKGVFFQANSYEHIEDGHTTEDAGETMRQVEKRNRKMDTYLMGHYSGPNIYGDMGIAAHVFVTWGSNKGAILDAMKRLEAEGIQTAMVHFTHVWPLDGEKVKEILTKEPEGADTTPGKSGLPGGRWILVENNAHAQFGQVLKMATGIDFQHKLLKYDGRQIFVEDIIDFVHNLGVTSHREANNI